MDKVQVIFDVEVYTNYFLASLKRLDTGKFLEFEMYEGQDLDRENLQRILESNKYEFIGFNSIGYDTLIIRHALYGASCEDLKRASDAIIMGEEKLTSWNFSKRFGCVDLSIDQIDIINVAPGEASLKLYAGRMHAQKMQDLPIDPSELISPDQREELKWYCRNDLANTELLLKKLMPQINIRREMSKKYGVDLRSKADAQIAEIVISSEVEKLTGIKVRKPSKNSYAQVFKYDMPAFVTFSSQPLKDALELIENAEFIVDKDGKLLVPEEFSDLKVMIGGNTYQLGVGGIHSMEKEICRRADDHILYRDADCTAYYPTLLLNNGLYPQGLGEAFLEVFRSLVDMRVKAKRDKDKVLDFLLKIVINSTFGLTGSKYSAMYSPKVMIQTTITGQLALCMLAEKIEALGMSVVSANTDGLVIGCPRDLEGTMQEIFNRWQKRTGFNLEYTDYNAIYNRDVNNYVAFKTDGEIKTKGFFATAALAKNPQNEICVDAVIAYLKDGTLFETTVRGCRDIRKFVSVIRVTGGAVKDNEYLGKVVRFYYAVGVSGCIQRKLNGNTVPRSTGARPLMDLPEFLPDDINYDWYLKECQNLLYDLGVEKRPIPIKLPRKNSREWKQMFADGLITEYEGKFIHVDDIP